MLSVLPTCMSMGDDIEIHIIQVTEATKNKFSDIINFDFNLVDNTFQTVMIVIKTVNKVQNK